jgi:hypothetical protein
MLTDLPSDRSLSNIALLGLPASLAFGYDFYAIFFINLHC